MNARLIAIDPGASGGIADFSPSGVNVTAFAMPEESELRDYLESAVAASKMEGISLIGVMEEVGGFIHGKALPGSAMFNFGNGYGGIRGMFLMARVELRMVKPQAWQKGLSGLAGEKEKAKRKRTLKEHAARLFPQLKVTLSTADALLIGDWARRNYLL